MIPLAQVIAIEFTTPAWTAVMAVAFLGERLNIWRILTIALGIIGVIIIVRPGIGTVEVGQLIVLGAALTFGISFTMVKSLTRTDSVVKIIFWMLIIQSAIRPGAIHVWHWPSLHMMPWVVIIAFTGTFSHFCMAKALQYADATSSHSHGLPARAADGCARLADLFRTDRCFHRSWCGAYPFGQSP